MSTGLARSALRGHRPAFVGTFVAALFAATVVSASTTLLVGTSTKGLSARARAQMTAGGVGDMATVMLIGSVYMSIFVIASTMGTAVTQQHRELALVRAVGARPRQVRRAVVAQAVAAAVPAALAGFVLGGTLLSRVWFAGLRDHGLLPTEVTYRFTWVALPVVLAVALVTSALAAFLAALRFSLLRPARALDEAAAGRRGLGRVRGPLGVLAVAGGGALSYALAHQSPDKAGQAAFLVLLLFCAGAGLLGPRVVGPAARLVSAPARRFGAGARLATLTVRSQPRRFSAAVVPLVLVTGFGLTKIALHTTAAHRTGSAGRTGEVWLDYFGTGLYAGFAAIAAANTLAMISFERRRDIALLRVVGTLPGQVRSMAAWEAGIVAATALVLGSVVALATLAPMLTAAYGSWIPYLPWPTALAVVGGTLLLTLLATGVPVRAALRRRAIRTLAAS
ncbi:FtsX-like permease family protein [Streptomyces sp. NBC_00083]|uniref:FtsX-like permease family protein n=1 Tax=Streptomyces sp. NBC_00083 TaxID=2975647 RepID=UPI00225A1352|nr:FtsX-like permease family protein [Streptomyces sp. NBC_00083]MCX5383276.1 FtsX-like permease family protein [Streptomyces sp. NBC_00083]